MVLWVFGILIFFALVVWLVVWWTRKANARYAQLWAALAPAVGGAHKGARMEGTYRGRPVRARLNPVSDSDNDTSYFYELTMTTAPRGQDWKLAYGGEKLLGFGEKRWHVSAKNEALRERLGGEGVVAALAQWGAQPVVSYKAKRGELEYREEVKGMFDLPAADRFREQLELLAHFAEVNERVNAA